MTIHALRVRRRSLPRAGLHALLAAVLALAFVALPASALDLEGEWYVLVHFEERIDPEAAEVSTEQGADFLGFDYGDAVWRFDRVGDDLRWTVFPDVSFRDETGRYEDLRGERARLRHAWRPSSEQLAEIRAGLALDDRTARAKTLRRRGSHGYASGASARASSASAVAFGERWEVIRLDGAPVFVRAASLSSGRTESLEGATRFEAETVDVDAGRIEGTYTRDASQTGRFYMWSKGAVRPDDAAFAAPPADASLFGPGGLARTSVGSLQLLLDRLGEPGGREDPALRTRIRDGIEQLVEESFTRREKSLRHHRDEIDALVSEIERLCVVEGVALDEIDRRFAAGELRT